MVYHNRTVRCPNCNKVVERTTTRDEEVLYGSPFRKCSYCGTAYFDPDYQEKAITYFQDKGGELSFWSIVWLLISNAAAISLPIIASKEGGMEGGMWLAFFAFLVLAIIGDVGLVRLIYNRVNAEKFHQKQIEYIEGRTGERDNELEASMRRLSDKHYLDALKAHEVDVPDYFYERLQNGTYTDNNSTPIQH